MVTNSDRLRILIFGGTFDPPHRAHVELPRRVAAALDCDAIVYVPAAMSPLKPNGPRANGAHRLAMLALAIADLPNARISEVDLERDGPSYTVDTLRGLSADLPPGVELFLLIGADQALEFHRWHEWGTILETITPVVVLRPPLQEETFHDQLVERYGTEEAARWMDWTVAVPTIDASSSEIREALSRGEDVGVWLSPEVESYVRKNRLYV